VRGYKREDGSANGPANLRANTGTAAAPVITTFENGIYAVDPRNSRQHQYTEELQALGSVGDFSYVIGGFYFHEKGWEVGRTRLPVAIAADGRAITSTSTLDYNMVNKSTAAFGQINWKPAFLDHKLELTGGLRWTKDEKNLFQRSTVARTGTQTTKNTSFLTSVNYQWTDDVMTYVKYSTGYRAGGFNVRAGATANPITFSVFIPRSTCIRFTMLFRNRPVGTSSTADTITCAHTSSFRTLAAPAVPELWPDSFFSVTAAELRAASHAGYSPNNSPVATESPSPNSSTGHSRSDVRK